MKKTIQIPNLADLTFAQVLDLAYQVCKFSNGKVYEDLAEETGKGKETIYRYFTDPNYNPPTHFLPKLCKALGNNLIIEWLCIQCEGIFVPTEDFILSNYSIEKEIAALTKEFSEVLKAHADASEDSIYTPEELSTIEKEIFDLQRKVEQIRNLIKRMKNAKSGRQD